MSRIKKRPVHLNKMHRHRLLVFIGGKFVQFLHEVRDNAVAAESVVLFIDIPHDLPVGDWVVSVLHVAAIALIEAIPQQRHHGLPDCLLVIGVLVKPPDLTVVLPGDHAQRDDAELLHPVFLNDLPNGLPVHRHSSSHCSGSQMPPLL